MEKNKRFKIFKFDFLNLIKKYLISRSGYSKQGGFEIHIDNTTAGHELYDQFFKIGQSFNLKAGCPNHIERIEEVYCHMVMIWILGIILNVDRTI